jgi:hypothetical protein
MTTGAWIMLVFGCVVLYGGLVWSLVNTKKGARAVRRQQGTIKKNR